MPVWGFAEVSDSRVDGAGGGHARVRLPAAVERARRHARARRTRTASSTPPPHRAKLPAAYNGYVARRRRPDLRRRTTRTEQMLLRPLFFTSYLIDDFLDDATMFGAEHRWSSRARRARPRARSRSCSRAARASRSSASPPRAAPSSRAGSASTTTCSPTTSSTRSRQGRAVYVDMAGDAAGAHRGPRALSARSLAHSAVVGRHPPRPHGRRPRLAARARGRRSSSRPTASPSAPPSGAATASNSGSPTAGARTSQWSRRLAGGDPRAGPQALRSAYLDLLDGRIDPAKAHILKP